MFDVICLGEMVIDFLPGNEPGMYLLNSGGAPANVAIAAARNDLSSGFIGKMGDDDFGRFLLKTLKDNGVSALCDSLSQEAITTMAFVTLDKNGERSFTFARKPGADMLLNASDIKSEYIKDSYIIHAGSCSLSAQPSADATLFALALGKLYQKLISFDVNYRKLLWNNKEQAVEKILKVLPFVDLLKISEEELDLLGGETAVLKLKETNKITVLVETLGPAGARAYWEDEIIKVEGLPGNTVDTTGAGDAFWGAFLSSLRYQNVSCSDQLSIDIIRTAMNNGNVAGTLCVQKKGALSSLPTLKEIQTYMKREDIR